MTGWLYLGALQRYFGRAYQISASLVLKEKHAWLILRKVNVREVKRDRFLNHLNEIIPEIVSLPEPLFLRRGMQLVQPPDIGSRCGKWQGSQETIL